jgi:5-methylcytosine-specific restriction endonuclease McrA
LCEQIAAIAAPVWRFCDGGGGGVVMQLTDACAREGLFAANVHEYRQIPTRVETLASRDGWNCDYCGIALGWGHPSVTPPEVEHRIPKSRGGTNAIDNLCLSCGPCNSRKGTRTAEEFRALTEVSF